MIRAHSVAQVRAAEEALMATLPAGALMQRAAAGLATACAGRMGLVYGSRVALLVGAGNNGADALWAGARLAGRGAAVSAVLIGDPVPAALAALLRAGGRVADPQTALADADLVVDGMVGIGGRGPLRETAATLAVQGDVVVAVDVPSGVDADTGAVEGVAVRAGLTVTFGTSKPGLHVGEGRRHAGTVHVVDIGLRPHLGEPVVEVLEDDDVDRLLPEPAAGSDKYSRGVVGIAAGSPQYGGAAVLACGAALRAGAGMIRFVGAALPAELVRQRWPEVVVTTVKPGDGQAVIAAGRVQAWIVGPGLGTDDGAAAVVQAVLSQDVPVLVDADALTICAQHPQWLRDRTAPTLLTPHDGEYARFGRDVGDDRSGAARRLAADLGITVLLKGDATVITDGEGPARVNATGSPVLATAGSGDVLSGAVGALLAQGLGTVDAGSVGAHLHGRSGVLSADGGSTSALLVLQAWPRAVTSLRLGH
ncbi:MAG: NAD(P)H-hydrate dehydratase [Mycobacteriales bacterium]